MTRSPFCYVGGKSRWVPEIVPAFDAAPTGCEVVSPFLGGGSVELALADRGHLIRGSDIDWPLVCAWNLLLVSPKSVARRLRDFRETHTPMTKDEANAQKLMFFDLLESQWRVETVELGWRYLVANRITFNGILSLGRRRGVSKQAGVFPTERFIERIESFAPSFLRVACLDHYQVLVCEAHEDKWAYCDPPYCLDYTRNDLYGKRGEHDRFPHHHLANALRLRSGPWVLSYNDCERVRELYDGWTTISVIEGRYNTKHAGGKRVRELLITRGRKQADRVEGQGALPGLRLPR